MRSYRRAGIVRIVVRQSKYRKMFAEVEVVAFDGYGTIIDFTETDFIVAMAEICADQGIEADAADVWKRFLRSSILMRSEHHPEPVYRSYFEAWTLQFEMVFKQLGVAASAERASEIFREKLADPPAFDEAYAVIEALRPHYRVALLSNADDDFLTACLARNNLKFETILTSEQARAIKPNPEIFHKLAGMLKTPIDRILYVGDNPIPDVLGPKRAGMKCVWLNRFGMRKPRKIPQPDARVTTLAELLPMLVPAVD